jgi:hypothetical protein
MVEGLLNDPDCFERTRRFLEDLELTDPGLFKIIADGTDGLSAPSADPPALPSQRGYEQSWTTPR